MSQPNLTENLDIIAQSDLEIQLLDGDMNIIQKLDDEPNDVGGMTAAELKAEFDKAGNIIKKYINETLVPAVLADDATEAARAAAEEQRINAERFRIYAEQNRARAEEFRALAEENRANAEKERVSAEAARAAAEQSRSAAEAGRQSAEEARETAETARATAEEKRNVWEAYDPAKAYQVMNKVSWEGASYLCRRACTGVKPDNTGYWLLIAGRGRDGYVAEGSGLYGFHIDDDGDLILTYEGDTPPGYAINGDGDLVATLDGGQTLDLGRVTGAPGAPGKDNLPNAVTLSGAEQSLVLDNNVEYRCAGALTSLTVTGFGAPPAGKAALYSIVFVAGDGITVTLPDTAIWAVAEPVWTAGSTYWITWTALGDKYLAVWAEAPNG